MNDGWAPYVSVAQRRANAAKQMQRLKKQGHSILPIEIQGRTIARTFWGKAWCDHMESFCDHNNRLPRGRTYVRNGSVCHLEINEGAVQAMVSGSSMYRVHISVKPLRSDKWQLIKQTCAGQIGSLLDLLSGKLSAGVMSMVCDPKGGLFPLSPDFKLACDCPDSATMCKHIAAVLYGVGSRLDVDPAQLFTLRGVRFEELIDVTHAVTQAITTGQGRRKRLDDHVFADLFNLDVASQPVVEEIKTSHPSSNTIPARITGHAIRQKRIQLQLTKRDFAEQVGVSITSIVLWEAKGDNQIKLNSASLNKLKRMWAR